MANVPQQGGKLDIVLTKAATYTLPFYTDGIGDLTTKTWTATIRSAGDNTVIVTGTVNIIDSTHGTIDFTATQTNLLSVTIPSVKYEWTVKYTSGATVLPLFQGMVTVIEL